MLPLATVSLLPLAFQLAPQPTAPAVRRASAANMGFLDGVKDAFGSGGDKPMVSDDRVTPFDRWLGLDKDLVDQPQADQSVKYVDPLDTANYAVYELSKPMGLAFVENEVECGGVFVEEVLESGSANGCGVAPRDQLVAVDKTLVLGWDCDNALEAITTSQGETTKLVFFRGPTAFLYGPTKPDDEWYQSNLLD